MKKTIISCVLFLTAVTAFSQTPMKTAAEAKLSASDLAVKIADRILATTTYEIIVSSLYTGYRMEERWTAVYRLKMVSPLNTTPCAEVSFSPV